MYISTYHVHTCIKVTSILTILYLLIYITSLITLSLFPTYQIGKLICLWSQVVYIVNNVYKANVM